MYFAQVINHQINIVRLSQMFVDADTIADIQLEGVMLFLVFHLPLAVLNALCCLRVEHFESHVLLPHLSLKCAIQVLVYILLELKLIRDSRILGYKTANPWFVPIWLCCCTHSRATQVCHGLGQLCSVCCRLSLSIPGPYASQRPHQNRRISALRSGFRFV